MIGENCWSLASTETPVQQLKSKHPDQTLDVNTLESEKFMLTPKFKQLQQNYIQLEQQLIYTKRQRDSKKEGKNQWKQQKKSLQKLYEQALAEKEDANQEKDRFLKEIKEFHEVIKTPLTTKTGQKIKKPSNRKAKQDASANTEMEQNIDMAKEIWQDIRHYAK